MAAEVVPLRDALLQRIETLEQDAHELFMRDYSAEALSLCDQIIALSKDRREKVFREFLAGAMLQKGRLLDGEAAIVVLDTLIDQFGSAPESCFRRCVAQALWSKSFEHSMLEDFSKEIATLDEIIRRYATDDTSGHDGWSIRSDVNSAYLFKIIASGEDYQLQLQTAEAWLSTLDQRHFVDFMDDRADAKFHKGVALGKLERNTEEIAIYDEVVQEFGNSPKAELRFIAARCLFNSAWAHCNLGDPVKEIENYQELIARYEGDFDMEMQVEVTMARNNLGFCLEELGRHSEAIKNYDRVISQHRRSKNPEVRKEVERARANRQHAITFLP